VCSALQCAQRYRATKSCSLMRSRSTSRISVPPHSAQDQGRGEVVVVISTGCPDSIVSTFRYRFFIRILFIYSG
jgi:hypothetical protein